MQVSVTMQGKGFLRAAEFQKYLETRTLKQASEMYLQAGHFLPPKSVTKLVHMFEAHDRQLYSELYRVIQKRSLHPCMCTPILYTQAFERAFQNSMDGHGDVRALVECANEMDMDYLLSFLDNDEKVGEFQVNLAHLLSEHLDPDRMTVLLEVMVRRGIEIDHHVLNMHFRSLVNDSEKSWKVLNDLWCTNRGRKLVIQLMCRPCWDNNLIKVFSDERVKKFAVEMDSAMISQIAPVIHRFPVLAQALWPKILPEHFHYFAPFVDSDNLHSAMMDFDNLDSGMVYATLGMETETVNAIDQINDQESKLFLFLKLFSSLNQPKKMQEIIHIAQTFQLDSHNFYSELLKAASRNCPQMLSQWIVICQENLYVPTAHEIDILVENSTIDCLVAVGRFMKYSKLFSMQEIERTLDYIENKGNN